MKWAGSACPFELYAGAPWDLSHGVRPSRQGFQGPAGALLRLIQSDHDVKIPGLKGPGIFRVTGLVHKRFAGGRPLKWAGSACLFELYAGAPWDLSHGVRPSRQGFQGPAGALLRLIQSDQDVKIPGLFGPGIFLNVRGFPAGFIGGLLRIQNAAKRFPGRTGEPIFLRQPDSDFVLLCREKIPAVGNGVLSACPIKEVSDGAPCAAVPDADVKKSARTGCCQQQSRENKQKCMK